MTKKQPLSKERNSHIEVNTMRGFLTTNPEKIIYLFFGKRAEKTLPARIIIGLTCKYYHWQTQGKRTKQPSFAISPLRQLIITMHSYVAE